MNRLELYKSVKKYEEIQERLTKCDKVRQPSDKVKKLKESSSRNSDFQWFWVYLTTVFQKQCKLFVVLGFALFHKHFMCADQLWNLRVFWLGIPIVVLHELFVKLVQNLPKKMGDIFFFFWIGKSKNLWKSVKKARMKCAKRFLERPMEQKSSA